MNAILTVPSKFPRDLLDFDVYIFNSRLLRWQAGDQTASSEFCDAYQPYIRKSIENHPLLGLVRSAGVDDLVQETLLQLLNAQPCRGFVKAYLRRIAYGRVRRQLERDSAQKRVPGTQREPDVRGTHRGFVSLDQVVDAADQSPTPDTVIEMQETVERLFSRLRGLDRRIVSLLLDGNRRKEIAGQLCVSERTVRRRLASIRDNLDGMAI